MRFNDVQDTRKTEVKKAQRHEAVQKIYAEFTNRLYCITRCGKRPVMAFGATFTI